MNADLQRVVERRNADERIRLDQQGRGRPIVAFKVGDHQVVCVGNTLQHSRTWKTFADFLADYIKRVLDPTWGNAELVKPLAERHPIIQWHDAYCRYQQATIETRSVISQATVTGIVACYLGLAYSLYLLAHNVELQEKLIRRLKSPGQFQGAYYELVVANILIRAGFDLVLEDEADGSKKHCEYAARSRRTGKKYWVEAKMRAVVGLLGRTKYDGTTDTNPLNRFVPQLNEALTKPAADERLIFIDLNADLNPEDAGQPGWIEKAARRLEQYERKELGEGVTAYVFVTNFAFHRSLSQPASFAGFFFGLGIPDLNRPGIRRVSDAYRTKQKHIDVDQIGDALQSYGRFPSTFDGTLPSDNFKGTSRVIIGETYCFGDPEDDGIVGTVTYASVNEAESEVLIAITDQKGNSSIVREPMSADQLADWRTHKDSYFGKLLPVSKKLDNPFDLFEWLVEQYKGLTRDQMLEKFALAPDLEAVRALSDEDLLYQFCECMVAAIMKQDGTMLSPVDS